MRTCEPAEPGPGTKPSSSKCRSRHSHQMDCVSRTHEWTARRLRDTSSSRADGSPGLMTGSHTASLRNQSALKQKGPVQSQVGDPRFPQAPLPDPNKPTSTLLRTGLSCNPDHGRDRGLGLWALKPWSQEETGRRPCCGAPCGEEVHGHETVPIGLLDDPKSPDKADSAVCMPCDAPWRAFDGARAS